MRNDEDGPVTNYDFIIELAVSSYKLNEKTRKLNITDMRHCLISWWIKNKKKFKRYNTTTRVGDLMNLTHCTVVHYSKHRKKSFNYNQNTECLHDFLIS